MQRVAMQHILLEHPHALGGGGRRGKLPVQQQHCYRVGSVVVARLMARLTSYECRRYKTMCSEPLQSRTQKRGGDQ